MKTKWKKINNNSLYFEEYVCTVGSESIWVYRYSVARNYGCSVAGNCITGGTKLASAKRRALAVLKRKARYELAHWQGVMKALGG